MKKTHVFWIALAAFLGTYCLSCDRARDLSGTTLGPPQKLKTLVTLRVPVQVVAEVTKEDGVLWNWIKTRSVTVIVIARGDALIGVDMDKAKYTSESRAASGRLHAILELPLPHAMSPRVDHDRSRTYRTDKGRLESIWETLSQDVRDEAFQKAQRMVEEAANDADMIAQAKEQAEATLKEFHDRLNCDLEVRWEVGTVADTNANTVSN